MHDSTVISMQIAMFFNFHLIMYEYVNIAIGMNVTFCKIGWGILIIIAKHEMCTNLSRPSILPKKKKGHAWGKAMVGKARLWFSQHVVTVMHNVNLCF